MDILSHGLWGGAAFGKRANRRSFWTAFGFGIAPDLLSFGVFTLATWLGFHARPDWSSGPPDPSGIPAYVHHLYDITHSLVVFAAAFVLVWWYRGQPLWEMGGWAFHIVLDFFTHTLRFFPTPILWPISDFKTGFISWSDPRVFIPNVVLLAGLYVWFWWRKRPYRGLKRG